MVTFKNSRCDFIITKTKILSSKNSQFYTGHKSTYNLQNVHIFIYYLFLKWLQ